MFEIINRKPFIKIETDMRTLNLIVSKQRNYIEIFLSIDEHNDLLTIKVDEIVIDANFSDGLLYKAVKFEITNINSIGFLEDTNKLIVILNLKEIN